MSQLLEITELPNGDVVLREAGEGDEQEPLLRIRFSGELRDMLGRDLVSVAEAMIDAATDYLARDSDQAAADGGVGEEDADDLPDEPPVVH